MQLVFKPYFKSYYTDMTQYNGQPFSLIGEVDTSTYDYEDVGTMFNIQFDDGTTHQVFPEEIYEENFDTGEVF